MTAKEIESEIMKLIVEVTELRAENKILKSVNDSLLQALHKPVIMQAEGSDVSEGAAVGNSAAGKGVCGGSKHAPFSIKGLDGVLRCAECGEPYHVR
jgi:hypothetical protein